MAVHPFDPSATIVFGTGAVRYLATRILPLLCVLWPAMAMGSAEDENHLQKRQSMIREIETSTIQTQSWIGKSKLDPKVMSVMGRIPRHAFVPKELERFAYLNRPLPVGHGQKVSQPYIVALMTDLAKIAPDGKVMILGMGGGYHAAIVSQLAKEVRCVEMFEPVAKSAMERLTALEHTNVEARVGDPYFGWRGARGAFDAIIVRQAMEFVPRALLNQLKAGGRIVMPLGGKDFKQYLTVIEKQPDGTARYQRILPVLFTKMPGGPRI